jgi:hypothetical protein
LTGDERVIYSADNNSNYRFFYVEIPDMSTHFKDWAAPKGSGIRVLLPGLFVII